MRNIPKKNYIIYVFLCFLTLLLLLVFVNKVKTSDSPKESVLSGVLYEISSDDIFDNIENYAVDNNEFFLYISTGNEKKFESAFKDYIAINNLNLNIIYFNGWQNLDDYFITDFKRIFFAKNLVNIKTSYLKQSNIYVFRNGEIVDMLYTKKDDINIEDVKKFIEGFGDIYD